jgi:hypothetical protein
MQALADAGYHAIAPDQRGYGQTGGPDAEDQYTIMHLVGDVIGLLDALDLKQVLHFSLTMHGQCIFEGTNRALSSRCCWWGMIGDRQSDGSLACFDQTESRVTWAWLFQLFFACLARSTGRNNGKLHSERDLICPDSRSV